MALMDINLESLSKDGSDKPFFGNEFLELCVCVS